ncbi:MAG: hypothetical protein ABFS23_03375 [Pseudomonadota bacterium]
MEKPHKVAPLPPGDRLRMSGGLIDLRQSGPAKESAHQWKNPRNIRGLSLLLSCPSIPEEALITSNIVIPADAGIQKNQTHGFRPAPE